jgi:hypothetical protein
MSVSSRQVGAELRTRSRRSGGFKSAWRRSDNFAHDRCAPTGTTPPRGVGRAWADLPLRAKGELLDAVAAERQAAIAAG